MLAILCSAVCVKMDFIYFSFLVFFLIVPHCHFDVNIFEVLVLIEHEVMGPSWTQAEGFILGVGAKMFTIAGPVIVYGVSASIVYGFIYWITTLV